MRVVLLIGLAIVGVALSITPADAQRRGWDRDDNRGGDDRDREDRGRDRGRGRDDDRGDRDGERGRRSWGGGGGNPEDFWKRFDRNGDGMIAPDEVDERIRDRLGIDKPTKIEDLVERLRRGREDRDDRGRNGRRDRDNNDRSPEQPAVPGFGVVADENATVPGFGPPEVAEGNPDEHDNARDDNSRVNESSSQPESAPVTSNGYVDGVFKERDANENGTLEGDELTAPGLPPDADKNGDGKITKQELLEATGSKETSIPEAASSDSARRSYRFASPHERLPSSAKSWIVARDKNGDGQVSMHEFSRTWSESKIREFQRYDLNGDGIITAKEYLAR